MIYSKRKWNISATLLLVVASIGCIMFFSITRSYRSVMRRHHSEMPYFASARRVARIVKPGHLRRVTFSPSFGGGGFQLQGSSYIFHAPRTPKGNPNILWGIQYFVDGESTGPIEHLVNYDPERFSNIRSGTRHWLIDVAVEENRFADEHVDDSIVYFKSMTLNNPISNSLQSHYRVRPTPASNPDSDYAIYMTWGRGTALPTTININEDIPVLVRFNGVGVDLSDKDPLIIASRARSAYMIFVRLCFELPEDWAPRQSRFHATNATQRQTQESFTTGQVDTEDNNQTK